MLFENIAISLSDKGVSCMKLHYQRSKLYMTREVFVPIRSGNVIAIVRDTVSIQIIAVLY